MPRSKTPHGRGKSIYTPGIILGEMLALAGSLVNTQDWASAEFALCQLSLKIGMKADLPAELPTVTIPVQEAIKASSTALVSVNHRSLLALVHERQEDGGIANNELDGDEDFFPITMILALPLRGGVLQAGDWAVIPRIQAGGSFPRDEGYGRTYKVEFECN